MVQWKQIHRTVKGCCLLAFRCAMYQLPLDYVSKNQLSTNQNLFNVRADSRNACWTCILLLDIVSPCIMWICLHLLDILLYSIITLLKFENICDCIISFFSGVRIFILWAPSSEFVSSNIPSWQILTAHAQPFRGAWDLAFRLKVPLDSLLV